MKRLVLVSAGARIREWVKHVVPPLGVVPPAPRLQDERALCRVREDQAVRDVVQLAAETTALRETNIFL